MTKSSPSSEQLTKHWFSKNQPCWQGPIFQQWAFSDARLYIEQGNYGSSAEHLRDTREEWYALQLECMTEYSSRLTPEGKRQRITRLPKEGRTPETQKWIKQESILSKAMLPSPKCHALWTLNLVDRHWNTHVITQCRCIFVMSSQEPVTTLIRKLERQSKTWEECEQRQQMQC